MEFILTLFFLIFTPAMLISGLIVTPLFRLKKPYVKPLAIVVGVVLSGVFAWIFFVLMIIGSAQLGHPF